MSRPVLALLTLVLALSAAPAQAVRTQDPVAPEESQPEPARSVALGKPWHGRLRNAVQLPEAGPDFMSWDAILRVAPERPERRWGTDALVLTLELVTREYRAAHPGAQPVLIGDLSRPTGGFFGREFGGLGHASHQNGLDADVMYPRKDRLLRGAVRASQVDRVLAQDLVNRFVAAGAQKVFVGPHVGLTGKRGIVSVLAYHDDHLHVRIPNPAGRPLPSG
ncbi:MAG: penicillin-insensitive murein endopeptidase [Solirubrobacteraceae bacterium]